MTDRTQANGPVPDRPALSGEWQVENWLSDEQISQIEYSQYWNEEEHEKEKGVWYILDGNFARMERYLADIGLPADLQECIEVLQAESGRKFGGVGIDLAAGNLWAAPFLLGHGATRLHSLEFSRHRLLKFGPVLLDHYNVPRDKVVLTLGSFYDIRLADHALDFVFMSQSFHHAGEPEKLLAEVRRVLKPEGVVIIIGEHIVNFRKAQVKHAMKFLISRLVPVNAQRKLFGRTFEAEKFLVSGQEACAPDAELGDHFYSNAQYQEMFARHGFRMRHLRKRNAAFQSFVLVRNP